MQLHQFDYLMAIGTIFAFLDAWNIGMASFQRCIPLHPFLPPLMLTKGNRCQ